MPTTLRRKPHVFPLLTLCLLVSAAFSGGCYYEGGPGFSGDCFVYISRPWHPVTVTLKDTRTGQDFWSVDVPVAKKLIVEFKDEYGTRDEYTPATMSWVLVDESYELGSVDITNNLPVPPWNSRLIVTTYRPAPELPESMIAATHGTAQPVKMPSVPPPTVTVPAENKTQYAPQAPMKSAPPAPRGPAVPASTPKSEPPLDLPDTKPGS